MTQAELRGMTIESWVLSGDLSHAMVHAAIFCPFNREDATSLKWWALNIYFWGGGELLLAAQHNFCFHAESKGCAM